MDLSESEVAMRLSDGTELRRIHDAGVPMADKEAQSERVFAKFRAIAGTSLGRERAETVLALLRSSDRDFDFGVLMGSCAQS